MGQKYTDEEIEISVLMSAYNAEDYISDAIRSIVDQTYQKWELLICDDASTDQTYEIIKSFDDERIRVFQNKENLKKPRSINYLFKKSRGALITVHDADDLSLPQRFDKIIAVFRRDPGLFMCGHVIERMDIRGRPLGLYRKKETDYRLIKESMKSSNTDGDPSIFIRREVFGEIGEVFRPYFNNNMDYDLALRVLEKFRSTNIGEVLSYYRNVPNSISKGVVTYKKLITHYITKELARQRQETGKDALMTNDLDQIEQWERNYSQPYILDKTLHLREMASFFMYTKMNKHAILFMLKAIVEEPWKWKNWHTLQYCIRRTLIGI
ncbi:MAG: glycosyltransferase family A protein [Marinoscillum sp.]